MTLYHFPLLATLCTAYRKTACLTNHERMPSSHRLPLTSPHPPSPASSSSSSSSPYNHRPCPVPPKPQMRPARQTHRPLRRLAEDAQADTAHEPHIHHPPMAETRRAEIHPRLRRRDQVPARRRVGQEREQQRRQEAVCWRCCRRGVRR